MGKENSQQVSARASPIKVKLNTPKFSGKSRDFTIYKKEFMDVIVPGRSDPERWLEHQVKESVEKQ